MPTIGLTGNFGMGKTTVLRMFGKMGAHTYDIDSFVNSMLGKSEIIKKIVKVLGSSVLSKRQKKISLDKKRVADLIFNDPEKRMAVEKIIHPEVLKLVKQTRSRILKGEPAALIVFEVPLLFEAGYEKNFDEIVVVYTSRKKAVARLAEKGLSKNEALERMRVQMSVAAKLALSDYSINNNYGLQRTEKRVKQILAELQ
jgi:dephospho-CoA kinase